jgi:hypothetical protein
LIKKAKNKRKSRSRQKFYSRKVSHSVWMLARGIVLYGVHSFKPFPVDFERFIADLVPSSFGAN